MGFSVTEKGDEHSSAYIYRKSNRVGSAEPVSAKSYFQQMTESSRMESASAGRTTVMEFYERMRRFHAMAEDWMPETDSPAEDAARTAEVITEKATAKGEESESAARKESQEEEDSKTNTEIIVKPDGSRVLVVTMNVGGTETSMTLEISKPTAMPNGNRTAGEEQPGQADNPQSSELGKIGSCSILKTMLN